MLKNFTALIRDSILHEQTTREIKLQLPVPAPKRRSNLQTKDM
jgi:hypothetical protein